MLDSNLKVLRARFPNVLMRILASEKEKPAQFEYSGSGSESILQTKRGDKVFPTYGKGNKKNLLT